MDIVTGAFGYIGNYIARDLLARGREVRTITTHFRRQHELAGKIQAFPFSFEKPDQLISTLQGGETLYNTYWIRFPRKTFTYELALKNTKTLFTCAKAAGIKRIVHISVSDASIDSPLPHYQGKAQQEDLLKASSIPCTIIRPTLVFGAGDILVNNMAWLLRRFPIFPVFCAGNYRLQPVFVEDLAKMAVESALRNQSEVFDAAGPEVFTFREMLETMASTLGVKCRLFSCPSMLGIFFGRVIGFLRGDVLLTANELRGLMDEYLLSKEPLRGSTRFSEWLRESKTQLGQAYASELKRHFSAA
jgi:NADH dehydrogenase